VVVSTLALLDDTDVPWLTEVVDTVVACAGKPWRVALERLDDLGHLELPRAPVRFAAAVSAVQRILGGRARNAARARAARSLVLGTPALGAAEREARIAYAAGELEVSCATVENLLWSDLPRERPVELVRGRPRELEVAAYANVHLLQRAMRRAHAVRISLHGDAGPVVRGAASRGLLMTVSLGAPSRGEPGEAAAPAPRTGLVDAFARREPEHSITHLDIVGPLALFHRTAVYGKAIADLVPLLADCEHFELTITAHARDGQLAREHDNQRARARADTEPDRRSYTTHARSPVLLPPPPAHVAAPRLDLQRVVRELRRLAFEASDHELRASTCSTTYTARGALVCPAIVIERGQRHTYVELLGFWTRDFLARKADLYAAAGLDDVLFCVDESRGCTKEELPSHLPVIAYSKRTTALALALYERTREPAHPTAIAPGRPTDGEFVNATSTGTAGS
jgi:predicted nuclease of restriction endonuclease-like RecB superfamily